MGHIYILNVSLILVSKSLTNTFVIFVMKELSLIHWSSFSTNILKNLSEISPGSEQYSKNVALSKTFPAIRVDGGPLMHLKERSLKRSFR